MRGKYQLLLKSASEMALNLPGLGGGEGKYQLLSKSRLQDGTEPGEVGEGKYQLLAKSRLRDEPEPALFVLKVAQ